jgi:poly-gamma-glutamate system protein
MDRIKLLIIFIVLILGYLLIENTAVKECNSYIDNQKKAIEKTILSFELIKQEKERLGIKIEAEDLNSTGLIGSSEYLTENSMLATTLGSLSAKRTSTNPHFSALMVKYFYDLGLKKGDIVVINSSGSFPALLVQVMSAVEVMELKPIVMISIGASIYGATNSNYTLIDMYNVLLENKITSHPIDYWSFGGNMDIGTQFDNKLKQDLMVKYRDIPLIYEENYLKNTNLRYANFYAVGRPDVFINIGGNMVALGRNNAVFNNKNGLIHKANPSINEDSGLIDMFLNNRIPVIHLLDINELAMKERITVDPLPLVSENGGDIFYSVKYNQKLIAILLILSFIYIYYFSKVIKKRRKYVKKKI